MSLLRLYDIGKRFGEVTVLRGIDLELPRGELLALIGENGAGKSTLMNIVGGLLPPTEGRLVLDGQPYLPTSPRDALDAGIAFIHQELNLFPNLTVAENLLLPSFPTRSFLGLSVVDRAAVRQRATALLAEVGLNVSPDLPLERLTPAQRQLVEIAKALSSKPRIIIFDEPTTSLTRHEVTALFTLIDRLRAEGIAMIYISHNLEDVIQLADQIFVLRDGVGVHTIRRTEGYDLAELVRKMVGRSLDRFFPARNTRVGTETVLEVEGLTAGQRVQGVSFSVRRGEVVGFYGLVGAGRTETARLVYGLDAFDSGAIGWQGEWLTSVHPADWVDRGLGFLTEDRREEGILPSHNIRENIALASYREFAHSPVGPIRRQRLADRAATFAAATRVKYNNLNEQPVATLSGGNQQKVILARWLMTEPTLLILDEPSRGIDIGAKHEIYTLINELVTRGASVLLISSEIEELLGMCDRILVMSAGRLTTEYSRKQFDREAILSAALHRQTDPV
ncbi:sugar ABC transporter ATP-binding protein [Neolewinella sp.]|uniref:sugar ABC transporter ATP-binding protein n=1 Tax=Neolewinella sp. TaxID=2993543 RepID=UPI003B527A87